MIFKQVGSNRCYIIELEKKEDNRGFFVRTFDKEIFKEHDINFDIVQTSMSYNNKKNTIRGMHYQEKPYEEAKLVQCIRGSIYDVILDVREDSDSHTKGKWVSVILKSSENNILYIPEGFAQGFQTLTNDTTVLYYMNEFYHPECSKTIYYGSYGIKWILDNPIVSDKDRNAING